tara:strand:- start:921 stop:1646 length:726 start_codon:yes stop_codon:yes gene_type:complete
MARISNYTIDTTVESSDKFIGSNSGGSTKNFKVSDISKHLRATNAAGVGGQLVYIYDQGSFSDDIARQAGKINFGVGGSGPVNFSDITGLKINKLTSGNDHSVENFIPSFSNTNIIIADTENQNSFGVFNVTATSQNSTRTNFYDLTLTFDSGNGNLVDLRSYSISVFTAGDKSFVFTQSSSSNQWVINHNLAKYPSVVVIEETTSANIFGEIIYNSLNQVTINFSGSTGSGAVSGKAFLN